MQQKKSFFKSNSNEFVYLNKNSKPGSNASSAYNSESNSFLVHNTDSYDANETKLNANPNSIGDEFDDDEKVVAYDMEGSLCGSTTRSNVSCLTFPNEPTADITFIRHLLARKSSTDMSDEKAEFLASLANQNEWTQAPQSQTKHKWSMISQKQFTPPVKLTNGIVKPPVVQPSLNRSLFHSNKNEADCEDHDCGKDFDSESIKYFDRCEEEERDEVASISSVPSEIRLDRSVDKFQFSKASFGALMNKLSGNTPKTHAANALNLTYTKEDSAAFMSPGAMSATAPTWSTVNNTVLDDSVSYMSHNHTAINAHSGECNATNAAADEAENDKRILYEFIDEIFSKSNGVAASNDPTIYVILDFFLMHILLRS